MFRECSDKNLNNLHRKYRFSDFLSEPPNPEPQNPEPPNPEPQIRLLHHRQLKIAAPLFVFFKNNIGVIGYNIVQGVALNGLATHPADEVD